MGTQESREEREMGSLFLERVIKRIPAIFWNYVRGQCSSFRAWTKCLSGATEEVWGGGVRERAGVRSAPRMRPSRGRHMNESGGTEATSGVVIAIFPFFLNSYFA